VEALAKAYKHPGKNSSADAEATPSLPAKDPDLVRLESELAERLGTRVTLIYGEQGRGQLVIDFDTLEILEGVLEQLGYTS